MRRAKRILLIASMLVLSAGGASASLWHRTKKPAPQPAPAADAAAGMTLNAIEVVSSPSPQIVLRTSGAPAFTSLSPTPDQFVVDLSGTSKPASLAIPSALPPSVSAITADEITEMGNRLTRVTLRLTQPAMLQAAADGNSVAITLPAPAIIEVVKLVEPAPQAVEPPKPVAEPVVKTEAVSLAKAKALKKIETAGSGASMDVQLATDGDASYSAFKLEKPPRIVIDMPGIQDKLAKHAIEVNDSLVKRIRTSQFKSDVTRVVVDLSEPTNYNISKSGDRIHLTFGEPAKTAVASTTVMNAAPDTKAPQAKKPVVEAAKPAPADVVSQVPAIADNATSWKMPQEASKGATAVIRAPDQAPPPPTPTMIPPQLPMPSTKENVFTEAQPTTPTVGGALAPGGSRTLSAGERVYTGEPISLNLKDADIKDVLRTFAQLTGLNMAIDPNVTGSVTVDFVDVPWDQALDLILRQNHLGYRLEGNVMRIGTLGALAEEAAATRRLREEERLNVPLTTVSFKLSYARAGDVAALLKDIASTKARILVDQRTNQLIISEVPEYLQTMRNLIDSVDVANRQVVIEARIVLTKKHFLQQWGFNWGFRGTLDPSLGTGTGLVFPSRADLLGGPFNFGQVGNPVLSFSLANVLGTFTLDLALNAAESESFAKVVSAPRVQTQDNVSAEISSGTQIPFQTRINFTTTINFVDATLHLTVTPQITEAGTVIMDIAVQKIDPTGTTEAGAAGPSLSTRSAHTKLMVRDGGTTVIGGIYETQENRTQTRMPFLHQIPVIGALFRTHDINNEFDELLIFITPRIVRTS